MDTTLKKPPTLFDVARLADVSTATVSRALSRPDMVNKKTLAAVHSAVAKLGYVTYGAGRALSSRRSKTIGAVIPTLDNAIFASTADALQRVLVQNGYMLLLACNAYNQEAELSIVKNLLERGVDGLVLVGIEHDPEIYVLAKTFQIPYVLTWAYQPSGRTPCVGFDNRQAGMVAVKHLLELGHQRFAAIWGLASSSERHRERLAGVHDALSTNGIVLPKSHIFHTELTYYGGRKGARTLRKLAPRATAVICSNDILAVGAIGEFEKLGVTVPRDISVLGFEDLEVASVLTPALTTIRFPTEELGKRAAERILALLSGNHVGRQSKLEIKLVVRESTSSPLKKSKD